jgi:hypothetical protein
MKIHGVRGIQERRKGRNGWVPKPRVQKEMKNRRTDKCEWKKESQAQVDDVADHDGGPEEAQGEWSLENGVLLGICKSHQI